MKLLIFLFCCTAFTSFTQIVVKENLTKKKVYHYDFEKTQIESTGSYYVDFLGETTEKHGKWLYYDKGGSIAEERNYYKGKLQGPVKAFYSNGKKRQEAYFKLDQQDSISREWYENGQLSIEGYYFKNKPAGKWNYFYQTGKKKMEEEIIDSTSYVRNFWLPDSLHTQTVIAGTGELVVFHTTGAEKEWYNYKNGLKHGPFEEYSIYGHTSIKGSFYEGLKDSTWTYAYYTGQLEKTSTYYRGVLEGPYAYYYDNGKLNVSGNYSGGKKNGLWTWYTNKGTKDMEGYFKNDFQDGEWKYWYPTGELSYTAHYKENLKDGIWHYLYKDGSDFKKGGFENDLKHGLWETWYEDGTLLMTGKYEKGKEEGIWKNYWDTGKLKNESAFKAGVLEGTWKSFYPSGKPKLTGSYKNGYKTGEWIDYFENGKPKDVGSYKVIKDKSKIEYGYLKDYDIYISVKHGAWASFSAKDFKKTEEGSYDEGQKSGQWLDYYPGGKIPAVSTEYKAGKLDGKQQEFDRRGNLISEIEYKDGLKDGKMRLFDKKGKAIVEKTFEKGQQVIIQTGGKQGSFSPGR